MAPGSSKPDRAFILIMQHPNCGKPTGERFTRICEVWKGPLTAPLLLEREYNIEQITVGLRLATHHSSVNLDYLRDLCDEVRIFAPRRLREPTVPFQRRNS